MSDIPIIFSAPMVRALLEGRKTMTRRIIKLPTKGEYVRPDMGGWAPTTVGGGGAFRLRRDGTREPVREAVAIWSRTTGTCIAARYQVGDRLWVRENFAYVGSTDPGYLTYQATYPRDLAGLGLENVPATLKEAGYRWTSSMRMPRAQSRLTLIVTALKIEPLQNLTVTDAMAEGIERKRLPVGLGAGVETTLYSPDFDSWADTDPVRAFELLWTYLHGRESWQSNPWVVAPTFRVIKANIDAPEASVAA